jgi:hypothetical protein
MIAKAFVPIPGIISFAIMENVTIHAAAALMMRNVVA